MIFTLEGNIGAGKSTILNEIQNRLKDYIDNEYCVLLEPIDEWVNFKPDGCEKSLFELFYQDNKKYGFAFQLYALQSRYSQIIDKIKNNKNKIIISERCPLTDNEIFAKIMHADNNMNNYEYEIYSKWHTMINEIVQLNMCGIIYLKTDDNVCASRVQKRSRDGESSISMDYLKKLNTQHDIWLDNEVKIPQLILDGNKENTEDNLKNHMQKIAEFIKKNSVYFNK